MVKQFLRKHLRRLSLGVVGVLAAITLFNTAVAQVSGTTVFLDYTNFTTRLNELASSAGVTAFNTTEINSIKAGILSQLQTVYDDYTVTFTESQPSGNYETVNFGLTASAGSLGLADRIDFRNLSKTDVARVYSANFDFVLDEFSGSTNRTTQLDQLTAALGGTAAHELAHNLGLQHHDSYGDPGITPANYGNTQNIQNTHIIATGSTGLSEAGREASRTFSELSKAKLDYADDLNAGGPPASQLAVPSTLNVTSLAANLPNADVRGINLLGSFNNGDGTQTIQFRGYTGARMTANMLSQVLSDRISNTVGSSMTLFDSQNNQLATNDLVRYNGNTFNSGAFGGSDSILLNYVLPSDGIYSLVVSTDGSDTGAYELFGTRTKLSNERDEAQPKRVAVQASTDSSTAAADSLALQGTISKIRTGAYFGECIGYCQEELTLAASDLVFSQQSMADAAKYPPISVRRNLSAAQWNRLVNRVNLSRINRLATTIGCPDCVDQGAEWIEVETSNGQTKRITFDYGAAVKEIQPLLTELRSLRQSVTS